MHPSGVLAVLGRGSREDQLRLHSGPDQRQDLPGEASPLRLGLVGCGRVVERYYLAALEACRVWTAVAACDLRRERREWLSRQRPRVEMFETSDALFRSAALDAVLVATPPATHRALVVQALEAGLGVLVEKPMALAASDASAIRTAALRSSGVLRVGFNRRFLPPYAVLRRRIRGPDLQQLRSATCRMSFDARGWNAVSGYRGADSPGGGILDDVASHQIDLVRWVTGDAIAGVRVTGASLGGAEGRVDYELGLAGGATVRCRAEHSRRYAEWMEIDLVSERLFAGPGRAVATRGPMEALAALEVRLGAGLDAVRRRLRGGPDPAVESFAAELRSFARTLRQRARSRLADVEDGLEATVVTETCRRALTMPGRWMEVG